MSWHFTTGISEHKPLKFEHGYNNGLLMILESGSCERKPDLQLSSAAEEMCLGRYLVGTRQSRTGVCRVCTSNSSNQG